MTNLTFNEQKNRLSSIVRRVLIKLRLKEERFEKLMENSEELEAGLLSLARELSMLNMYTDEELGSDCRYPEDYKPKSIEEQADILRQSFPELKNATFDQNIIQTPLPQKAEAWFAIPRWQKIDLNYGKATNRASGALEANYHIYAFGDKLLERKKTLMAFNKIADQQKGHDILIVPCQFGLLYGGYSVRRVLEVTKPSEFTLNLFSVACMLLSNLQRAGGLGIQCSGDMVSNSDGTFCGVPMFKGIYLCSIWEGYCQDAGTATGFLLD